MAGHPDLRAALRGRVQQELARRRLRGARSWRPSSAARPHVARRSATTSPTTWLRTLGGYGAAKVYSAEGPEGLAQPVVDAMAKVMDDDGHDYALFGGGLLGFEIGAGLAARLGAGVTMEVTGGARRGRQARRRAPDPRRLGDLGDRATAATSASSSAA